MKLVTLFHFHSLLSLFRLLVPLGIAGMLVQSMKAEEIFIPDPALQRAVAYSIGVNEKSLTLRLVQEKLEYLEANDRGIRDLRGLEHAYSLKTLVLRDNLIENFSPLADLKNLVKLDISGNRLSNLDSLVPLAGTELQNRVNQLKGKMNDSSLSNEDRTQMTLELSELSRKLKGGRRIIRELNLAGNRLLGLSGIHHFTSLVHLDVSENALLDLEGVGDLKNLVNFFAQGNQLGRPESYTDENRNKQFDQGESFRDISGNGKRDSDPLAEIRDLEKLSNLHLYNNSIKKVDSLSNLPRLNTLLLSGNQIEQIRNLGQFDSLRQLSLSNNRLYSLDGVQSLFNLNRLNLAENQICDLRPLRNLSQLRAIDLHSNLLINLSDMSLLRNLESVGLSRNFIEDPTPIFKLPRIKHISLAFNYLPLENEVYQETAALALAKGARLQVANQQDYLPEAKELVNCLLGFPDSNRELGNYLRENRYLRLTEFLGSSRYQEQVKKESLVEWKEALLKGKPLVQVPFPRG
jgi:Leucine-rich repeat (LRR) protein